MKFLPKRVFCEISQETKSNQHNSQQLVEQQKMQIFLESRKLIINSENICALKLFWHICYHFITRTKSTNIPKKLLKEFIWFCRMFSLFAIRQFVVNWSFLVIESIEIGVSDGDMQDWMFCGICFRMTSSIIKEWQADSERDWKSSSQLSFWGKLKCLKRFNGMVLWVKLEAKGDVYIYIKD